MKPIASHITVFLQQYLPVERGASVNTCESYAYAFKLLFEYASNGGRYRTNPACFSDSVEKSRYATCQTPHG